MQKVNIGIIGLGGLAQLIHLPVISKMPGVNLHSVCDTEKSRLNNIADKFGVKNRFERYEDMMENTDLDAVIISTPTYTHPDIALYCIDFKKPLLIEKPVATTYRQAKVIYEKAQQMDVKIMVGMNLRFRPDSMLLKSILSSGELGKIFYIKGNWLKKQSSPEKWFLKKSDSGGGVIIDLGIGILDLGMWLTGYKKVESVSVQSYKHRTGSVEDSAVGLIRFEDDQVMTFEISWSFHSEQDSLDLTFFGTEGTAHLNPLRAYKRSGSAKIDYTPAKLTGSTNYFQKSFENELNYFIGVVKGINPLVSSLDEALMRMKLLEAIYESAESKTEVKMRQYETQNTTG